MRKQSLLSRNSGTYTSPGTPEYQNSGEIQKGSCSERVPLPSASKRHVGATSSMPFNSGRALPSKWDDAERWITSPVSVSGVNKNLYAHPQRRPKSKSGPIGPPSVPLVQRGSPFSTGVLVPDCVQLRYGPFTSGGGVLLASQGYNGNLIDRAASLPCSSDMLSESSEPSSQDEKLNGLKDDVETTISRDISRRDMATQMSRTESQNSSPIGRLSFSHSPPTAEIKDLQVDDGVKRTKNDDVSDVKVVTSSWEITETSRNISNLQREEAKISAWENLQKAKAEAAIQKLEMKLEKRRAASMDKIMNKLKNAQLKAQDMRNSASNSCTYPRVKNKNSPKATFFGTFVRSCSLRGFFSCVLP